MLDHPWKHWVAENKLLGIPDQTIVDTMKSSGISEQAAREEIKNTLASPYYQAATIYAGLLRKRDSLAMIERGLQRLDPSYRTIERKPAMPRAEFLAHHYSKGRPVILNGLMTGWKAMERWTPEYLKQTCGTTMITIATQREANLSEAELAKHRKTIRFADHVDRVENAGETSDFYMPARGELLKDPQQHPEIHALFDDMEFFPEYLDPTVQTCHLWYGPKGAYTPLHHELMNMLVAQVQGHQKIRLIPATEMDLVYNDQDGHSPIDVANPDYAKYPKFRDATVIEVDLFPGEVLFIPVGWWHDVQALTKSITVSFTNFVFPNEFAWATLKRERPVETTQTQQSMVNNPINAEWMKWIEENLRRGCDPVGMVEIMEKNGFPMEAIRQAMGMRFPSRYGMAKVVETAAAINYKALAELPVAQMEWMPGFNRIDTGGKLQIYTLEHFLTDAECDALVELVDPTVRPSTITVYIEGFRTSYTSDLVNLNSPFVEAIEKKISMAIGIRRPYSEGIQAQRYDVGQEFKAHTDYFEPNTQEYRMHAGKQGNRTWTFMIYLNNVDKGGGTQFTKLGKTFQPQKGTAVIWNSLYPDGSPNPDSMHWGMPVEEGRKYVITKWFREIGDKGPMFYNEAVAG